MEALSKAQIKQLALLEDGEWHNIYNNGVKGLKENTLDALVRKGLVEKKEDIDRERDKHIYGRWLQHYERDTFYRVKKM